ncbi:MAG: hypothetical protein ACHQCI_09255 [Solirubrobacterales bacterium]
MDGKSPRRPSPSMVVAMLALFISLTGTAAALKGRNSVDSGDIKPRQVKTGDLANNAATGAKVLESSLGQVPSAASATNAGELDNVDSSGFLRSTRLISGNAYGDNALPQVVFTDTDMGVQVLSDGTADPDADYTIKNVGSETLIRNTQGTMVAEEMMPDDTATVTAGTISFVSNLGDTAGLMILCFLRDTRLHCFGIREA